MGRAVRPLPFSLADELPVTLEELCLQRMAEPQDRDGVGQV